MKPVLIALTALTLSFSTAYAADVGSEAGLYRDLAAWHGAVTAPHVASYADASLTEVVDGYWRALSALGYDGIVTAGTPASTTYAFGGAAGALTATFVQKEEAVVVALSRETTEVSLANASD